MSLLDKCLFYNEDCIFGSKKYLADNSIDLIITDPPYGIEGNKLDKHYNRNENLVLDGYIEIPQSQYASFSLEWIKEAERVLKPGGTIYIVSGYTNLIHILNALKETRLIEKNHIIWKYNFGVYTKTKYISSHYHILYYIKSGGKHTFNTFSRYGQSEKSKTNGSLNYEDREDVWIINKEYKSGKIKNKNELPTKLLKKIIQYSSNEGDIICDFFLGSFSTAKVAIGMNRIAYGFEKNKVAFDYQISMIHKLKPGYLLKELRKPENISLKNQGKRWSKDEIELIKKKYKELKISVSTKKEIINILSKQFQRGYFSILKVLKDKINLF